LKYIYILYYIIFIAITMRASSKVMLVFLVFGILFAGSLAMVLIPQAEAIPIKRPQIENPGYENSGGNAPQYVPPSIKPR
jgi:hypothetical protein